MLKNAVRIIYESLLFKISALIVGLILAVVGIITYATLDRETSMLQASKNNAVERQKSTYERNMLAKGKTITRLVKDQAENAVLKMNFSTLQPLAENAASDKEIAYVNFLGQNNVVMAHSDTSVKPMSQLRNSVTKKINQLTSQSDSEFVTYEYTKDDEEYMEIASPIRIEGQQRGLVRIGFTKKFLNEAIQNVIENNRKFTAKTLASAKFSSLTIAGLSLVIGLIASFFLARRISNPVVNMQEKMQKAEDGDLRTRVEVQSRDEIGQLSQSFNNMMENLSDIVGDVLDSSNEIADSSSSLASVVSQSQQNMKTINQNVSDFSEGAKENANVVEESSEMIQKLSSDSSVIAQNSSEMMEKSETMKENARAGKLTVSEVVDKMENINRKVDVTRQAISDLQEAAENIEQISNSIEFITEKTNTLAYNVSISAVEAGGEAKEIAEIAKQVRTLADESSSAAGTIRDYVDQIQNAAMNASEKMSTMADEVNSGVDLATESGNHMEDIVESINVVHSNLTEVNELVEEQNAKTQRMENSMTKVSRISNQIDEGTGEVAGAVDEQTDGIDSVSGAAESMKKQASQLKKLMDDFVV